MTRTTQAAIIFILAVITMALGVWGRMLAKKTEEAVRERDAVEERIDQAQLLRAERLAVSHRLKRLYGRAAQLEAVGAPAEEQGRVAADIANTEKRLEEIKAEMEAAGPTEAAPPVPAQG